MPIRNYFLPAVLIVLVASGCSTVATQRVADPQAANLARVDDLGDCARYLVQLDGLVETHAVADAQYARIPGYPYLRTNRFMSSGLKPESDTREFDAWVDALMKLGHEARDIEYANLPARALDKMGENRTHECAERLRNSDLSELDAKARLREVVRTPDSYRVAHRILGLYPLASTPLSSE